ncbi:hypothetical protein [Serratia sp. M24T3]|uniref:hypothetical protein n=1 Tax=Serratia sp. M24T3 TaxID=932213 RepID=UPI0002D82DF3|nr:hypothetical protein [Serratia sp. M24T3]
MSLIRWKVFIKKSAISQSEISSEIALNILDCSHVESERKSHEIGNGDIVTNNQLFCVDEKTGIGHSYLHERDKPFNDILSDKNKKINVFLPGYATGDRYTLIFTALIEPRLEISIAYTEGNKGEEKAATEAFDVIKNSLIKNGELNPEKRLTLLSYLNNDLKAVREKLDDSETKSSFTHIKGSGNCPLRIQNDAEHMFHISATTEIINRHFRDNDTLILDKFSQVKEKLHNLVTSDEQEKINSLVDDVIKYHGIKKGDVALWIADREFANERESQAISRPRMFDLIADYLKKNDISVFCIADTYINRIKTFDDEEVINNRHPHRLPGVSHIGRFWAEPLLSPRENQWYFMDKLLEKTGGKLIGIRSGALEPFALMGHNIIYLEHKNMFTPERHASWQGVIPYRRLITEGYTGYINSNTEVMRDQKINNMLSNQLKNIINSRSKYTDESFSSMIESIIHNKIDAQEFSSQLSLQNEISEIQEDIASGVMSENELKLLVNMLNSEKINDSAATVITQHANSLTS